MTYIRKVYMRIYGHQYHNFKFFKNNNKRQFLFHVYTSINLYHKKL